MSHPVEIAAGQCWSSPEGMLDTIRIVRPPSVFDDAWVVTGGNRAACLSTAYILSNYWLMDLEPAVSELSQRPSV